MKEHPILFSTPMVQAILAGRKTQTRRKVKLKKIISNPKFGYTTFTPDGYISVRGGHSDGTYGESFIKCPYGQIGDILWVRETWANISQYDFDNQKAGKREIIYKATQKIHDPLEVKWKPSIFMFKKDSRIKLMVKSTQIEKLVDISEQDAKAEGAPKDRFIPYGRIGMKSYKEGFLNIWLHINGQFDKEQYVWVVKFEKL